MAHTFVFEQRHSKYLLCLKGKWIDANILGFIVGIVCDVHLSINKRKLFSGAPRKLT